MSALFGQTVFTVGDQPYAWADVVLAAMAWGDWGGLEAEVRQGLACARRLDEGDADEEEDPDAVGAAADEFRYARDLLTVEETEAWLARWGLTTDAWMDAIRRSVLRQMWADDLADIAAEYPAAAGEVAAAIATEGICSGTFARFAWKLAGRAAAHDWAQRHTPAAPPGEQAAKDLADALERVEAAVAPDALPAMPAEVCRQKLHVLAQLNRAFHHFRDQALTPKALRDAVSAHHLDWIALRCHTASFADRQAAQEAALCVREDGDELAVVAQAAGAAAREERFCLEEADSACRGALLGARAGDVVGPLPFNGGFALFRVLAKDLPSLDDPGVRERAVECVLDRAVQREITDRVRWHFPL